MSGSEDRTGGETNLILASGMANKTAAKISPQTLPKQKPTTSNPAPPQPPHVQTTSSLVARGLAQHNGLDSHLNFKP